MSDSVRNAILRGVAGAAETHEAFTLRDKHKDGLRPIDVFELINELEIPLEFKPLDKLLGACVRVDDATVGILITTQRDLHMQRFTAAHELGHFVLEHEGSLDREVRWPGHTQGRDLREVEADAFAAEFLMPKWLMTSAAKRRSWWSSEALMDPMAVYQLSLRLASSYEATCWGLASHDFISSNVANKLVSNTLKALKHQALQGIPLGNPWADVWVLGSGDDGATLHAGSDDIFILEVDERASAGFRWDLDDALDMGFGLLQDESHFSRSVVGGSSRRRLIFSAPATGVHEFTLSLRRSFSKKKEPANQIGITISTVGTVRENPKRKPTLELVHWS